MIQPSYTFVSVSTARPGRLDDLVDIASAPTRRMDGKVPGLLAYQVSVDRERNSVIVWATFAEKSDLYDYLATDEGEADHTSDDRGEEVDMDAIIETFEMYDLTPASSRL